MADSKIAAGLFYYEKTYVISMKIMSPLLYMKWL